MHVTFKFPNFLPAVDAPHDGWLWLREKLGQTDDFGFEDGPALLSIKPAERLTPRALMNSASRNTYFIGS